MGASRLLGAISRPRNVSFIFMIKIDDPGGSLLKKGEIG